VEKSDALPSASPRILLVEDHDDTADAFSRLLERSGYDVTTAMTAKDAVEIGLREPFDLLMCDIGLPDFDGWEILGRILKERPIRGIAVTGSGMVADHQKSLAAGFLAHLTKPVDFQDLLATISMVIHSGQHSTPSHQAAG
jgi:two-component system CheB/CheR fusion protein